MTNGSAPTPTPAPTLSQIARTVENLTRARALFQMLGLAELYHFPGLAFFDLGGARLMLRETGQRGPADILYFKVADIDAAVAGLRAKDIAITHDPRLVHRHDNGVEEWMAFFQDDEGRDLALHMLRAPA